MRLFVFLLLCLHLAAQAAGREPFHFLHRLLHYVNKSLQTKAHAGHVLLMLRRLRVQCLGSLSVRSTCHASPSYVAMISSLAPMMSRFSSRV